MNKIFNIFVMCVVFNVRCVFNLARFTNIIELNHATYSSNLQVKGQYK